MLVSTNSQAGIDIRFAQEIHQLSCEPVETCYQCQKCASGCPVAEYEDFHPNQIIRMIQLGFKQEVLQSKAIWLCAGCETCGARCPNEIHIAQVMDTLREIALAEKKAPGEKNIPVFHATFLKSVQNHGRVHEAAMMMCFKLKSGQLLNDLGVGLKMIMKGKLSLLEKDRTRKAEIREVFRKAKAQPRIKHCANIC